MLLECRCQRRERGRRQQIVGVENMIRSPEAALAPVLRADAAPPAPPVRTRTGGPKASAMARLPSVDPSSTTTISSGGRVWFSAERSVWPRNASPLRQGTTTERRLTRSPPPENAGDRRRCERQVTQQRVPLANSASGDQAVAMVECRGHRVEIGVRIVWVRDFDHSWPRADRTTCWPVLRHAARAGPRPCHQRHLLLLAQALHLHVRNPRAASRRRRASPLLDAPASRRATADEDAFLGLAPRRGGVLAAGSNSGRNRSHSTSINSSAARTSSRPSSAAGATPIRARLASSQGGRRAGRIRSPSRFGRAAAPACPDARYPMRIIVEHPLGHPDGARRRRSGRRRARGAWNGL